MGTVSRVHTFASGAVLTAAQLNTEFDNLLTSSAINGGLNATNLGVTAGQVAASKALVVDSSRDLDDTTSSNMVNNLTLSGTLKLLDDKTLTLGTGSDITVGYDETTTDSLKIAATEAAGLAITLMADEGDDAGDEWKLNIADGGTLTLGNDIASAGTYVTGLTITPHATTASWAMDFEGDVDIGGDTLSFNGAATIDTSGNNALSLDAGSAVLTLDGGTLESDASTLSFDAAATIDTSGNNALTLDAGSAVLTLDGGTLESDATTLSFDAATSIDTSGNNNLTLSAGTATLGVTAGDVTIYDDNNNADTSLSIGTSATEALVVQALNGGSDKTLEELRFTTKTASGTANHGQMSFYVDEVNIGNINDGGITLESGMVLTGNVTGNASGTAATVTGGTQAAITTCTNLVTTGALNSGSITSGFGTINNGSSTITTTGALAAGDTTISGDVTLTSATSAEPILTIKDTNADGNAGYLKFLKDGTSAADDDALGNVVFYGENDAGTPESILYADLYATSTDVSDGTEDGSIVFRTRKDGTLTSTMVMASGNVGVGGTTVASFGAPTLTVEGTCPTLLLVDTDSSKDDVTIHNNNDYLYFYNLTDTTTLMTLSHGGDLEVTAGDLVIGTAGKGISFAATSDVGGASSELLDDYEEGTFTGIMQAGTGSITLNSATDLCRYTKIGRLVHVQGSLRVSSVSSPSGAWNVGGLPFTVNNNTDGEGSGVSSFTAWVQGLTGSVNMFETVATANGTIFYIAEFDGSTSQNDMANHVQADVYVYFSGTYTI